MLNSPLNNPLGNTQAPINTLPVQTAAPSDTPPAAPTISYTINCNNQPDEGALAKIPNQPEQPEQPVLAQVPFQVNTQVVHSEDELFQIMYNRIVAKLEADRDASSAGKH